MADTNNDPDIAAVMSSMGQPQQSAGDADIAAVLQSIQAPTAPTAPAPTPSEAIGENPVNAFVGGLIRPAIANFTGAAAGGLSGLWDLAMGRGASTASKDVESTQAHLQYQPKSAAEEAGAEVSGSNWNPLNWPGLAIDYAGRKMGDKAAELGAPPAISTMLRVGPAAAASLYGMKDFVGEPYKVAAEEVPPSAPPAASATPAAGVAAAPEVSPETSGPPIEGGVPDEAQTARAATLKRVGIDQARESAIQGNAKDAATDFQMTRYDQPAGRAAAAQFDSERNALAQHAQSIIEDTGGTIGMGEDDLANRGAAIASPFDKLGQWFKARTKDLYAQAQTRSQDMAAYGNPTAYTQLQSVDQLLQDPTFQNTLGAMDRNGFLTSAQRQLQFFRKNNPVGFTPVGAEQYRQWLNSVWTPENKWAIGKLTNAVDSDVMQSAGDDLFESARAMHQMKAQTLDNPDGIADLFSHDPKTPINRSTAYEKIPDALLKLPVDQFQNVLKTLQGMPPELQPDAQAALGEIRGHLANKLLQAGTQTKAGNGAALWGADRVAQVLRANAAKFQLAFNGRPDEMSAIQDLNSAGQILKVDASYPGADAQAANAMKRGLISRSLAHAGGAAGAAAGSIFGPFGAAAGGTAGEMGGEAIGAQVAEKTALKGWQKRVRSTSEAHP